MSAPRAGFPADQAAAPLAQEGGPVKRDLILPLAGAHLIIIKSSVIIIKKVALSSETSYFLSQARNHICYHTMWPHDVATS